MEIRQWGRQKPPFRRSLLPVAQGIAPHDRLNDVMNAFGGGLFSEAFATWVKGLREDESGFVTSDGKTPRRARGGRAASPACGLMPTALSTDLCPGARGD